MAARKWTKEQRDLQAQNIHLWEPWKYSTGPRTSEGIEKIGLNAKRHGLSRLYKLIRSAINGST